MRFVIQRVKNASVTINKEETRNIGEGLMILMGIHKNDTQENLDKWVDKILKLRIFPDDKKPINASIQDIQGEVLIISQFTLYADTKGQNRPSFLEAAKPDVAKSLYNQFVEKFKSKWPRTKTGEFAADMDVSLTNFGPVTIILED